MRPRRNSSGSPCPGSWVMSSDGKRNGLDPQDGSPARRRARGRRDHVGRADPGPPGPDRGRRLGRARVPPCRHRWCPGGRARVRCASGSGQAGQPTRRGADRGEGRHGHGRAPHHVRLADPRGLDPAVRRDGGRPAQGRRAADPRQDQHGRVRHGQLDRALRLRPHPQPVGPRPDPGRLGWGLRRGGGRLRGAAGRRHRHRRIDPATGSRHRDRRGEADVRRGVALRPRRPGQLARPGRTGHSHRAGRGAAARGDRRTRPARLHVGRRATPGPRRSRPPGSRRRPDRRPDRRDQGARRRGLPERRAREVPGIGRPDGRGRCRGRRGVLPELRARAGDVLPDPAGGGVEQPREVRRHALRPPGPARRHRRSVGGGRHARHPRRRVRRRGEAPDHPRHLRPVQRLLRRLLRPGAEGPHPDQPRLRRRVRAGRRARVADGADHRVQAGREGRRPARDVPQRPRDDPGQPVRSPRHLGAERTRRGGRAAGRHPGARPGARRRPGLPGRCRAGDAPGEEVGWPDPRPSPPLPPSAPSVEEDEQ